MPKTNPATGKPRHVLLATDLTASGDRAFDRAVLLAKDWGAALAICHVVESSSLHPIGIERRIRNVEAEMAELQQRARAMLKQTVSRQVVIGDPTDRVIEHARAIKTDFIVTGPAHAKSFGDGLFGSTAARILRHADVPVLSVRRRASGDYRDVAVSVDFSSTSAQAVTATRQLFPKATLTLVHAYDVKPDWSGRDANKHVDEIVAAERATVKRIAGEEMARLVGTDAGIKTVMIEGESGWVLSDYVDEKRPDLVVTGTHGRTGVRGATIGSTAETLLNKLTCDVLAIRPED
jgi:nucleotide-binding universal stress UspA family protein